MAKQRYIRIGTRLLDLQPGLVMGILNLTPDSFYGQSRLDHLSVLPALIAEWQEQGMDILDIGAISSRPGAAPVDQEEEWTRLRPVLDLMLSKFPSLPLSLDTFRSEIATRAIQDYGVGLINDISAGHLDKKMADCVANLEVPIVLMHMQGVPASMQDKPVYQDLILDIIKELNESLRSFVSAGVKDIIIDPGFGFGKSLNDNFQLLSQLDQFQILDRPIMVGVSRKSMIYKKLGIGPDEALNGSTVVHTIARIHGADILRVHDVQAAKECLMICNSVT